MTSNLTQLHAHLPEIALWLGGISLGLLILVLCSFIRMQRISTRWSLQKQRFQEIESKLRDLENERSELLIQVTRLSTQLSSERKTHQEKLEILGEAREKLSLQFQQLANHIFDEKQEKFGNESRERLQTLLKPLQDQITTFRNRIETIQENDIRERTSLKNELRHLKELNQQLNTEAVNLTKALQGDQKTQGNWGELVLERILEKSGLRNGEEYSTQGGFRDSNNRLLRPDVIVQLPGDRSIIIDSKVSLCAWEKYSCCEDDGLRQEYLKEHLASIRRHIKGLSEKHYPDIKGMNSLDFVLLFIPIDASLATAGTIAPTLFTEAYERHIIIVTPTTLLVTLRTIENFWRQERQNKNARVIADTAGSLYDKFCGFLEDMDKLGKQLNTCTASYDSAMNKLRQGRGNLIGHARKLSKLGVPTKKEIPQSIDAGSD